MLIDMLVSFFFKEARNISKYDSWLKSEKCMHESTGIQAV